jgi:CSLREA domain-containing protein
MRQSRLGGWSRWLVCAIVLSTAGVRATFATTFVVNSTGDGADLVPGDGACDAGSGSCTLRAAIAEANAWLNSGGPDEIHFAIAGSGVHTIAPAASLPSITEAVVIDGYTQPGSSVNTQPTADDAVLLIQLNGANAGPSHGLRIVDDGCSVRGLVVNGFQRDPLNIVDGGTGVLIEASNTTITGNFVGTDPSGSTAVPNKGWGVQADDAEINNVIGGFSVAERNILSGNGEEGVSAGSASAVIGNFVGTDASGAVAIPNGTNLGNSGVLVGINSDVIGNVISGNIGEGAVVGAFAEVRGNFIGTNSTGSAALPNSNTGLSTGTNSTIGGLASADRNIISGNGADGVEAGSNSVVLNNYIGTDATGLNAIANSGTGLSVGSGCTVGAATGTTPGGPCTGACNLISGNTAAGLAISSQNVVQGNFVGTNVTGLAALPNSGGVAVHGANNQIGGSLAAERNLISGNAPGHGLSIVGPLATNNMIQGNYVGTDVTGLVALGNENAGISIHGAPANTIGGASGAAGGSCTGICNVIAGNGAGVDITNLVDSTVPNPDASNNLIQGNFIGLDQSGFNALPNDVGVLLRFAAHDNTVGGDTVAKRNLISGNTNQGVHITSGSADNTVEGNYIGLDTAGAARGNGGAGVRIFSTIQDSDDPAPDTTRLCKFNMIGGFASAAPTGPCAPPCNVIAANGQAGVAIDMTLQQSQPTTATFFFGFNFVHGNYIGTDTAGTAAIPNAHGVALQGHADTVEDNLISGNSGDGVRITQRGKTNAVQANYIGIAVPPGGPVSLPNGDNGIVITTPSADVRDAAALNVLGGNVIAGNAENGVVIDGDAAASNTLIGNRIGTDFSGAVLSNGGDGVAISGPLNTVGGTGATTPGGPCTGGCNAIAFNGGNGVLVSSHSGNLISANAISQNALIGIDLNDDSVTLNDAGDPDGGANLTQNFPVLTAATVASGTLTITGFVDTAPGTGLTLEFFANTSCDPTTYGEGETYLGSFTTNGNPCGTAEFVANFSAPSGQFITATARDANRNTSEFSVCCQIGGSCAPTPPPCDTPTSTASATSSATATATPTATASATATTSATPTATPVSSPTRTPSVTPTPSPGLDHFSCYRAVPQGPPNFPGFSGVSLVDRFGAKTANSSPALRRLCAPTNKNGEDPTAPSHPIHLEAHRVVQVQPNTPDILNVELEDQFGTIHVDVGNPRWLLSPTLKILEPSAPPGPPALVNPPVDDFLCYDISPNAGAFPTHQNVSVQDQFLTSTVRLRARWLCTPVNKNGEDPTAPMHEEQLTCYRQLPPLQQPASPTFAWVRPPTGPERLRVRRRLMVCVPSVIKLTPCQEQCIGGSNNGDPCFNECPGGSCIAGVCQGGPNTGLACLPSCPGGSCVVPVCCCQPAGAPLCTIGGTQCGQGGHCGCP